METSHPCASFRQGYCRTYLKETIVIDHNLLDKLYAQAQSGISHHNMKNPGPEEIKAVKELYNTVPRLHLARALGVSPKTLARWASELSGGSDART